MSSSLTAREFPAFDVHVESSARYYTDLSIACECAAHGMAGADDALERIINTHRVGLGVLQSSPNIERQPIHVPAVMQRVARALGEILAHQRRVETALDLREHRSDTHRRDAARKKANLRLLAENNLRIVREMEERVRPIIQQVATSGLPAVSLAAPAYFLARAVLWRVSPEFASRHEEALERESRARTDRKLAQDAGGLQPSLFLDLDPLNPGARIGYRPSTPRLALVLAGLAPWPIPTAEAPLAPPREKAADSLTTRLLAISWGLVGSITPRGARLGSS